MQIFVEIFLKPLIRSFERPLVQYSHRLGLVFRLSLKLTYAKFKNFTMTKSEDFAWQEFFILLSLLILFILKLINLCFYFVTLCGSMSFFKYTIIDTKT
jgi:hypothetical protein